MQLLFTIDELQFLANLISKRSDQPDFKPELNRSHKILADLLEKLIARNQRFDMDELEAMCDLLREQKAAVAESERAVMQRVEEKVNEACVMM